MGSPTSPSTAAAVATDSSPQAQTLNVGLGERSYPIVIGAGLIDSAELLGRHVPYRDVLLVTNTLVGPLYAQRLETALARALPGRRVVRAVLPDGEQHKSLESAGRLFDVLIGNRFGRDAAVLALGGGVIGDLAGFVAACYQRGVDLVQLPTTLLAHVDSSVGGKTAVNHPGGKNLIGAFHQPRAVIADTQLLASLPPRELSAGLAEVIKYGLVCDAAFFAWLESHVEALRALDGAALAHAIRRCCEIKAQFVARDEREQGERALLNLGHTFGHAIESATGYQQWLHGEAVAVGMLMAADLSQRLGQVSAAELARLRSLLARAGLPVRAPPIGAARALEYMRVDKKVKAGRVRLVLMQGIGRALLSADYPDAVLEATLSDWFDGAAGAADSADTGASR
ncbi:MAG TPA: 3-dehydroquinate synthase [Steroidobacteraceae bacterium]|jgi:3-dehydroquinate synthase|nr:3-dehydroquinate synthase [Steroidobacteraceae bacterium]